MSLTPGGEGEYGSKIGRPGVRVIYFSGEELDEAFSGRLTWVGE